MPAHDPRLNDAELTEHGATLTGDASAGRILLIGCGALAREILALKAASGWAAMDLICLPAKLHNRPDMIPEAVRQKAREGRAKGYASIFVVYADCGTGGLLDKVCEEEGLQRVAGPHCYAFYDGLESFEARGDAEMRAFYLTDFLARQFEALIWRGMGLDRHPELRDDYFRHYDRVIYLAQTDDPALTEMARAGAEKLGLGFERRFTGYGDLAAALTAAAK